jgi:colanic acid biosynthesis protein WcaH
MISPKWLAKEHFDLAVEALPLVSVDLCVVCEGKLLLGKRNNRPAQGWWFTPGGRIRKGEAWDAALQRIADEELGLTPFSAAQASLMGVWDHFYKDSAFSEQLSTHYVNLPHYCVLRPEQVVDLALPSGETEQHSEWCWLPLERAANDVDVHSYVRVYAQWLLDAAVNKKAMLVDVN